VILLLHPKALSDVSRTLRVCPVVEVRTVRSVGVNRSALFRVLRWGSRHKGAAVAVRNDRQLLITPNAGDSEPRAKELGLPVVFTDWGRRTSGKARGILSFRPSQVRPGASSQADSKAIKTPYLDFEENNGKNFEKVFRFVGRKVLDRGTGGYRLVLTLLETASLQVHTLQTSADRRGKAPPGAGRTLGS